MIDHTHDGQRPEPESLLQEIKSQEKGRLKIFFGAAPGVGKTYAMLQSARQRKEEGIDVVIGLVETHGRVETEELLQGFEIIPRLKIDYKGHVLSEMNLDAIIARNPQMVVVDELAHTNAQGSRHPKRYQDIEELLARGIDVYTSLNVQHIESLNDIVAQITRIRVRETVPDAVLAEAELILVDLPPDELIGRLHDGKVYIPEQAQKAIKHFFAPGNLTALRELALRCTAERVDEQMLRYMKTHAIKGPWPAGERVMVCVSGNAGSSNLVRAAKRSAERLHAKWVAVYVETGDHLRLDEEKKDAIAESLRLADRLGAEVVTLSGINISDEIVRYAIQNNVTRIILGASRSWSLSKLFSGSTVHNVIRKVEGIDVMVVSPQDFNTPDIDKKPKSQIVTTYPLWSYGYAVFLVLGVSLAGFYLNSAIAYKNILMLYLIPVLLTAVEFGLFPSLFASLFGLLTYKLLFSESSPIGNLPTPNDFVSMMMFLFVAFLVSNLASRIAAQAQLATAKEKSTAAMYDFSRKLAGIGSAHDLMQAVAYQIAELTKSKIFVLLPLHARLQLRASFPDHDGLAEDEMVAAQWSFDNGKAAGTTTDTLPALKKIFLPMNTAEGTVGVIACEPQDSDILHNRSDMRLLLSLVDQAAVAIQRMEYSISAARLQLKKISERINPNEQA